MNYEKVKIFISEHKPQLMTFLACAIMFVVGFGTGQAVAKPQPSTEPEHPDYSANSEVKPVAETKKAKDKEDEVGESRELEEPIKDPPKTSAPMEGPKESPTAPGNDPVEGQPCIIKGNISGSNKIYHVKGGASYEKTSPEKCFNTEAEAQAAGFRKAKR